MKIKYLFLTSLLCGNMMMAQDKAVTDDIYLNPSEDMVRVSASGMISQQQARFDIDALVHVLSEVHPNMFANTTMKDFMLKYSDICDNLPDSSNVVELYQRVAPLVAMIGDSHTNIFPPVKDIIGSANLYCPVFPTIDSNTGKVTVKCSVDNIVPFDSEIVSINGISADDLVKQMESYIGAEREFYLRTGVNEYIYYYLHMFFKSSQYTIEYREPGSKKVKTVTLDAVDMNTANTRMVLSPKTIELSKKSSGNSDYSYRILDDQPVAILSFNSCRDRQKMEQFAESMFATLKEKGIKHLVIDVRTNGGGDSGVGDILLKYISPKPFAQYGMTYERVSPVTLALGQERNVQGGVGIGIYTKEIFNEPLPAEQRFDGKVYLLVSHSTFSSASSFAWAFKEAGCGKVIGEETGCMSVHFGDVVGYTLPVSGLKVSISHKLFWLPGASEKDVHGTLPDVYVPEENALVEALKIIKKSKK